MKRILAMLLALVCVFSLSACGFFFSDSEDSNDSPPPGLILDETEPTEDTSSVETEPVNKKPEFMYVMAPLHRQVTHTGTNLWFVVEFKAAGYRVSTIDSFKVVSSSLDDVVYDSTVYTGYVCNGNHPEGGSDIGSDCMQYVVCVESDDDLDYEDVSVMCNLVYGYMDEGHKTLNFNLGLENITLSKSRLHGNGLYVDADDVFHIMDTDITFVGRESVAVEFVYTMAPLYIDRSGFDNKLWFVAEFDALGFDADGFEITNARTGERYEDIVIYEGNVCSENHSDNFTTDTGLDYKQYSICVTHSGDIAFDDLKIVASVGYDGDYDAIELEFNGDLSDITTYQEYLHGNTLFELDGNYYIHDDRTGMYTGDTAVGETYEIVCVNGSLSDLMESLTDNVSFVYGPVYDVSEYEGTGFGANDSVFDVIYTPDGCEMYIDVNMELVVGYQGVDDYVLSDSDLSRAFIINLRYDFSDGREMIFVAF